MFIPTLVQEKLVDQNGMLTEAWRTFFEQLLQNMQQSLSDEGIVNPSQDAANMAIIQSNAENGTVIFNTSEINGGSPTAPNGQLYVKLADGTFHAIPNL